MNRSTKISLSIIALLFTCVIIEILLISHPRININKPEKQLLASKRKEQFFQSDRITTVKTENLKNASISVSVWNQPKVQVNIESNLPDQEQPYAYLDNSVVIITQDLEEKHFTLFPDKTHIEIKFPNYLNTGKKSTAAIVLTTESGSIKVEGIEINKLNAVASSGNIDFISCNALSAGAKTSSGLINCESCTFNDLSGSTASGRFKFSGKCESAELLTTSGGILFSTDIPLINTSSFHTSSGSIKLNLPENSCNTFSCRTSSGSVYNEFAMKSSEKNKTDGNEISVAVHAITSSGDITIKKN
jgi:hypothetical protein